MTSSAGGGEPHRLLITGAAGNMGGFLRPLLRRQGRVLRLTDIDPVDDPQEGEESLALDVLDAVAVSRACQGVWAILHLGGISTEAPFDDVLRVNVIGTHNVLAAAAEAGVAKVLLASSNHAVGFYDRADVPPGGDGLPDALPPRPDTFYGWSKAAVESLGYLYHDRFGIDVTAMRIGTCFPAPPDTRALSTWFSPADAARLVEACLAQPHPGFRVVWGVSANTRRWWSLDGARAVGFEPVDDAEIFAADLLAKFGEPDPADPVHDLVGGSYCLNPLGQPPP